MEKKIIYDLMTKPSHQGERGEKINRCEATSLTEAILIFAKIKNLDPNQLIEIFKVYEHTTDGR
mgnify:CR=1 FL=1